MNKKYFCNKCNREVILINDLELKEFKKFGSFICSDCINEEMLKSDENIIF